MANVTIVGAGLMGTATAYPLSDNGHRVYLVGTHLDKEIIQSCKEKHLHPRLKRQLPPGVRSFYLEEMAEACTIPVDRIRKITKEFCEAARKSPRYCWISASTV